MKVRTLRLLTLFLLLIAQPVSSAEISVAGIMERLSAAPGAQHGLQSTPLANPSGLSGMYYDPAHNGEGFVIDVTGPDRAAVYWFTYDNQGRQRWFLGVAAIDESGFTVDEWTVTRGARFGGAFDPEEVEYLVAGEARFTVLGCDTISVDYTIDDTSGSQQLVRLASVADTPCSASYDFRSGLSGSYFNPDRNGEGVVLHVYDGGRATAVFFTYNAQGEQMWVMGIGEIQGEQLTFHEVFTTAGGEFGASFNPDTVEYLPWGALSATLTCETALFNWVPLDEALGDGGSLMGRLTKLAGLSCDEGVTFQPQPVTCLDYSRSMLTTEFLLGSGASGLVANQEFAPARHCGPAHQRFEAGLSFPLADITTSASPTTGNGVFPNVTVHFTTVGDYLVPVEPGLLWPGGASPWHIVFSEGRVWSEPGDGPWSRAAVPFTLSHVQWNAAHHGLMTFLYDGESVSSVHLQIVQENVPWAEPWDGWAVIDASRVMSEAASAYQAERLFRRDLATRLPVLGWDAFIADFGVAASNEFSRGVAPESVSQAGVAVNGQLYLQPAYTRGGDHPYPQSMRHGAFSVSKTAGAAVALLRLAQKYGESVFDERIADHIEVTADHSGWDTVTFGHTLSMVTGIGDGFPDADANMTFADESDEQNLHWHQFNYSLWVDDRLRGAFSFGNYPWGPAEVMRYNSSQTMILAVAMDNYLKSREGEDADLWEMVNREVFRPLGIRWLPSMRLRINAQTPSAVPMGWGLLMNPHDAVRIAMLLQAEGQWNGAQLLHRQRTRQAMRMDGNSAWRTSRSLQYGGQAQYAVQYRDGLWSAPAGAGCSSVASYMEGAGGNFVMMMPTGTVLFRFADGNVYDAGALISAGARIKPGCGQVR